jgi:hypothetical protein
MDSINNEKPGETGEFCCSLSSCNVFIHLYSSPQSPIILNKLFDFVQITSISS